MACSVLQMTFFFFFSLLLLIRFSFSEAQKVPAIYVFGDSLVDVGNNNYLKISIVKADFPHNGVDFPGKKSTGRFSNGKNAADFIGNFIVVFYCIDRKFIQNKVTKQTTLKITQIL